FAQFASAHYLPNANVSHMFAQADQQSSGNCYHSWSVTAWTPYELFDGQVRAKFRPIFEPLVIINAGSVYVVCRPIACTVKHDNKPHACFSIAPGEPGYDFASSLVEPNLQVTIQCASIGEELFGAKNDVQLEAADVASPPAKTIRMVTAV